MISKKDFFMGAAIRERTLTKRQLALSDNEWRGLHMAVEAQVVKAALDKKPLVRLIWQGLLDKIEKIVPFTTIEG